jgi:hypothetical protein
MDPLCTRAGCLICVVCCWVAVGWGVRGDAENGGCANCTMTETHTALKQDVIWEVKPFRPPPAAADATAD